MHEFFVWLHFCRFLGGSKVNFWKYWEGLWSKTQNLRFNQVGIQGAERLAAALEHNTGLTTLHLGYNQIGVQGYESAFAAIHTTSTRLTYKQNI